MHLVVIIDAGHGLYTKGKETTDKKMKEFEFNNITAQYFKSYIDDYENIETHYVHDLSGKIDVPLTDRINKANAIYAKYKGRNDVEVIYISFHANAHGDGTIWTTANGIETYVYKKSLTESFKLANNVQSELISVTKRPNRGVKEAPFRVIKETDMTAILIECGFMTHREEAALLKTDGYRKICAKAISDATAKTYGLKAKAIQKPVVPPQKEEDKMLEKAIVINAFPDFPFAELLAARLKAPIFTRAALPSTGKITKELFVVGGTKDGLDKFSDKITVLSGPDRFAVAKSVKDYLSK
jgi:N-acetylmuramoyl-L-alanine amidase